MDLQQRSSLDHLLSEDTIDLRQYWFAVLRFKWGILALASMIAILVGLVVYSMDPVYRSSVTLLIESNEAKVVSIEQIYDVNASNRKYHSTQFEILKSRKLIEKVVRKYDLLSHPEFNREPLFHLNVRQRLSTVIPGLTGEERSLTPEQKMQGVIAAFSSRLVVAPVKWTELVRITFEAYDPDFAAQMANAVADAYIESNLDAKLDMTIKASSWLNGRMSGLKEKLRDSEKRLQQFREHEQIIGGNGGLDIASNEIELLATKLVDARRQRLELDGRYGEIRAIGNNAPAESYERIPAVLGHPVVQSYKESLLKSEQKLSELSKRYGPKHPKMIAATSEVGTARRALDRQIMSVVNGIENQYRVARSSEGSLERELGGAKQQIQGLKRKEYRLKELEQEVESNRELYDTFFTRMNETAATDGLESANARIVDPAVPPLFAFKPKKSMIIAFAFLGGVFFGAVCAVLMEVLNNTIRGSGDVQAKLGQAVLGVLPKLSGRRGEELSYRHYIDDNRSGFSEAVRTIRTGLMLSSLDNPHKIIAVTSTVPGEGKTSTSLNLAYSIGQMERVLLIDADMRRPSIGKLFEFGSRAPGLSSLVAGTASLDECLHKLEKEGIDVISAGAIPPNPLELLSSVRFERVLGALEKHYDRIIIDTAPCQAVSDALVLSRHVGSMVYVVKADAAPSAQIKAGLKRLAEVDAPVVGVVLNQVNLKKASRYYGEGYSGYYDVYGYGVDEKAA